MVNLLEELSKKILPKPSMPRFGGKSYQGKVLDNLVDLGIDTLKKHDKTKDFGIIT
jgi:hypothetical protein